MLREFRYSNFEAQRGGSTKNLSRSYIYEPPSSRHNIRSNSPLKDQLKAFTFSSKSRSVFICDNKLIVIPYAMDNERSDDVIAEILATSPDAVVLYVSTSNQAKIDSFFSSGNHKILNDSMPGFYSGQRCALIDIMLYEYKKKDGIKKVICCAMPDTMEFAIRGDIITEDPKISNAIYYVESTIGRMIYEETDFGNFFIFLHENKEKRLSEVMELLSSSGGDETLILQTALMNLFLLPYRGHVVSDSVKNALPDWQSKKVLLHVPVMLLNSAIKCLYTD